MKALANELRSRRTGARGCPAAGRHPAWALSLALLPAGGIGLAAAADPPRERIPFNDHWRFMRGDPTCFEPFSSPDRPAFNGRCLAIVPGKAGSAGTIRLVARADGLKTGTASIRLIKKNESPGRKIVYYPSAAIQNNL